MNSYNKTYNIDKACKICLFQEGYPVYLSTTTRHENADREYFITLLTLEKPN
jgi:hypothetical protein